MTGPIGEPYSDRDEIRRLWNRVIALKQYIEELQEWATERYQAEVTNRPIENIHRETLRITWQQIIDKLKE